MFVSIAVVYPSGAIKWYQIRPKYWARFKKLASKNYLTSLSVPFMTQKNCFYNINSWGLYYKSFYGRNLRIFVISWNVCAWESLSSLVQCLWVRPGAYPRVEHLKVRDPVVNVIKLSKLTLRMSKLRCCFFSQVDWQFRRLARVYLCGVLHSVARAVATK